MYTTLVSFSCLECTLSTEAILTQQQQTIDFVVKILKSFAVVNSIFLMGSHAKGDPSPFSDIDVGFVFSNSERPFKEEIFLQISQISPALCTLWLFDRQGLFLFENGVRLDVDFLTEQNIESWNLSQAKILYDPRDSLYQNINMIANTTASRPAWRDEEGDLIEWFFWMFRQTYCYIRRAEIESERHFNKLYEAQRSMMLIRDKLIEMKIYLNGSWDYLNTIDQKFAQQLGDTFTNFQPDKMKKSTKKLFEIFERVAKVYCRAINAEFPSAKSDTMKQLFEIFDSV